MGKDQQPRKGLGDYDRAIGECGRAKWWLRASLGIWVLALCAFMVCCGLIEADGDAVAGSFDDCQGFFRGSLALGMIPLVACWALDWLLPSRDGGQICIFGRGVVCAALSIGLPALGLLLSDGTAYSAFPRLTALSPLVFCLYAMSVRGSVVERTGSAVAGALLFGAVSLVAAFAWNGLGGFAVEAGSWDPVAQDYASHDCHWGWGRDCLNVIWMVACAVAAWAVSGPKGARGQKASWAVIALFAAVAVVGVVVSVALPVSGLEALREEGRYGLLGCPPVKALAGNPLSTLSSHVQSGILTLMGVDRPGDWALVFTRCRYPLSLLSWKFGGQAAAALVLAVASMAACAVAAVWKLRKAGIDGLEGALAKCAALGLVVKGVLAAAALLLPVDTIAMQPFAGLGIFELMMVLLIHLSMSTEFCAPQQLKNVQPTFPA